MKVNEVLFRLKDPSVVAALAKGTLLNVWGLISRDEFSQIYRIVRPYTMMSYTRLRGLHNAVEHVAHHNIPGDIVECGTARGGSAALMGLTLKRLGTSRTL